jgi:hypothetical protein
MEMQLKMNTNSSMLSKTNSTVSTLVKPTKGYYGPALAGPFYEIGLKILHDLLRSSMDIK